MNKRSNNHVDMNKRSKKTNKKKKRNEKKSFVVFGWILKNPVKLNLQKKKHNCKQKVAFYSNLATKAIEGLPLALESVDTDVENYQKRKTLLAIKQIIINRTIILIIYSHIHGRHCLASGVFGVRNRITDYVLQKDLEDSTGFLIDQSRDTLDTTTTGQTTNGGLKQNKREKKITKKKNNKHSCRRSICKRTLVMPWMLSRRTFRWRLAPPFPSPFPPLPRPDMLLCFGLLVCSKNENASRCEIYERRRPSNEWFVGRQIFAPKLAALEHLSTAIFRAQSKYCLSKLGRELLCFNFGKAGSAWQTCSFPPFSAPTHILEQTFSIS